MRMNHPKTIPPPHRPWKNCLPRNQSLVPKRLGTTTLEHLPTPSSWGLLTHSTPRMWPAGLFVLSQTLSILFSHSQLDQTRAPDSGWTNQMLWIWNWAAVKPELQTRGHAALPAQLFGVQRSGEAEKSGLQGERSDTINYRGGIGVGKKKDQFLVPFIILFPILWKDLIHSLLKSGLLFMTKHHILFMLLWVDFWGSRTRTQGLWYLGRSVFTPPVPLEKERGC